MASVQCTSPLILFVNKPFPATVTAVTFEANGLELMSLVQPLSSYVTLDEPHNYTELQLLSL